LSFTERVSVLLREKRLNQNKLAAYIGVPTSTLNNWLKFGRDISADYVIPICEFIDVSPIYLLSGKEPVTTNSQPAETIFDPDLKNMIDVLSYLMTQPDECLRHWTIVQFEKAFINEMNELAEKKQNA
jgi:transcriptional regulator with XRE-family HTH domain